MKIVDVIRGLSEKLEKGSLPYRSTVATWVRKSGILSTRPRLIYAIYALCVVGYFGAVARTRYVSRSQFLVTKGVEASSTDSLALSLINSGPSSQDAHAIIAFIHSMDMLVLLNNEFDFRSHYSSAALDLPNRLSRRASLESMLSYYNRRVGASYDGARGIISLQVEAFEPEFANEITRAILRNAEVHINERNKAIARRQVESLQEVLAESEAMVTAAHRDIVAFQNEHFTIDPAAEIQARQKLILGAQEKILSMEIEKTKLMGDSPNSPRLAELSSQMAAIRTVIKAESRSLIGGEPEQLNQLLAGFTKLAQAVAFAEQRYAQSLSIAQGIRLQTLQQNRFISLIESPFVPEEGTRPRRAYSILSFLVIGLLIQAVLSMVKRTIDEHGESYTPV